MLTINHFSSLNQASQVNNNWVDVRNINDEHSWLTQYQEICQQHEINKKWILMIDPQDHSLEQLCKTQHIDISRILRVNSNQGKVNLKNLGTALSKGNCAAIILSNAQLATEEILELSLCAEQGKTACIVLTNHQQLH